MQINWFTVIAQIVNFIVLVFLLKRFLYKPILDAIDEREKKIAGQIKDAEAKDELAKNAQVEFAKKNDDFDKERKFLLDKAIEETDKEKLKLLEAARKEAADLTAKLHTSLIEMQDEMGQELIEKTQQEVFAIARKALAELANLSLEEQTATVFIQRLNELKKEEKNQFMEAFKIGSNQTNSKQNKILVQSAFDLPSEQQKEICAAINELLETEAQFQFTTVPQIISGIELSSNGYKLAWSLSEYMKSLQKTLTHQTQ